MTMKRLYLAVVSAVLGGLCIIGVSSRAEAFGYPGTAGTAASGGERSCFNEFEGGVRNDCAEGAHFVLPTVEHDAAGPRTIRVAATGVAGTPNNVRCRAVSFVSHGTRRIRTSDWVSTQAHTGATEVLKLQIHSFNWGATYAYCIMAPGTLIHSYTVSLNYNHYND